MLDPETRDDERVIQRSKAHLDKLMPHYLTNSLNQELAMYELSILKMQMESVKDDISTLILKYDRDQNIFAKT